MSQPEPNTVDFTIGGQSFAIPVPTLWHAKESGLFLPPQILAQVERALDIIVAFGAEKGSPEALILQKETLLRCCLLGEVPKLLESFRELMTRAGLPPLATGGSLPVVPPPLRLPDLPRMRISEAQGPAGEGVAAALAPPQPADQVPAALAEGAGPNFPVKE